MVPLRSFETSRTDYPITRRQYQQNEVQRLFRPSIQSLQANDGIPTVHVPFRSTYPAFYQSVHEYTRTSQNNRISYSIQDSNHKTLSRTMKQTCSVNACRPLTKINQKWPATTWKSAVRFADETRLLSSQARPRGNHPLTLMAAWSLSPGTEYQ
jgi:hypothetical protein